MVERHFHFCFYLLPDGGRGGIPLREAGDSFLSCRTGLFLQPLREAGDSFLSCRTGRYIAASEAGDSFLSCRTGLFLHPASGSGGFFFVLPDGP